MDTYDGDNKDPMSLHKYLYTDNNPINESDPNGRYGEFDISVGAILE